MQVRGSQGGARPGWPPVPSGAHPVAPWLDRPAVPPPRLTAAHGRRWPGARTFRRVAVRRRGALLGILAAGVLAVGALVLAGPLTGARTVSTPFLSYTLPAGWTADATDAATPLTAALTGAAHGPGYDCGGGHSVRGFAAAALLPTGATPDSGPAGRAERLARWFAAEAYPPASGATVAPPRPVPVTGPHGPVDGTVTELTAQTGAHDGCPAVRGTVLVVAAPVSGGAALLLVAGDTDGGPADPAPPDRATLDAVLASVRLVQG